VTDSCAHPFNFIGGDGRPYATATEQDASFHDTICDSASKRDSKIGVVVMPVVVQIAEVHYRMALGDKQHLDGLFHFVSAMIGGYANFHLFTSDSAARARSSSMSNSGLCTHWAKRESRIFRGYTPGPFHPCPH